MKDSPPEEPAEPRRDHGEYLVRKSGRRLSILETTFLVALLGIVLAFALPVFSDWRIRTKVSEAVGVTLEARKAIEDSCKDRKADPEAIMSSAEGAGSEAASSLSSTLPSTPLPGHVRDLLVEPIDSLEGKRGGRISMTFAALDDAIEEGARLVFTGYCLEGGIEWTVDGDLPRKYRPSE